MNPVWTYHQVHTEWDGWLSICFYILLRSTYQIYVNYVLQHCLSLTYLSFMFCIHWGQLYIKPLHKGWQRGFEVQPNLALSTVPRWKMNIDDVHSKQAIKVEFQMQHCSIGPQSGFITRDTQLKRRKLNLAIPRRWRPSETFCNPFQGFQFLKIHKKMNMILSRPLFKTTV